MRTIGTVIGALLLCCAVGQASDGYVEKNGYYFYQGAGDPYTRTEHWRWIAPYYSYGRYYAGYWSGYYTYSRAYPATVAKTANWREDLVLALKSREAAFSAMAAAELENRSYQEALKIAGFPAAMPTPSVAGGYGAYGAYNQQFVAQGQTVYGSTFKSVLDYYGDSGIAGLLQGAVRSTETAQGYGDAAHERLLVLARQASADQAKVVEFLARSEAWKAAMRETSANRLTTELKTFGTVAKTGNTTSQALALNSPEYSDLLRKEAANCIGCHSGAKLSGGFDVTAFASLPLEKRRAVLVERILAVDPSKMMPRGADGKGYSLPTASKANWTELCTAQ